MTSSATATKKRPAPATSPPIPNPNNEQTRPEPFGGQDASSMTNDQFLSWGSGSGVLPFSDSINPYGTISLPDDDHIPRRQPSGSPSLPPNNQLIRRVHDQQLAQKNRGFAPSHQEGWRDGQGQVWGHHEDGADLEKKATSAKRDALSKKKQIPPFIQKLSSFLDNNSNTDLIRWTDSGDSFVVLDEEQFANRLIPELFKHNNYASFVRQLNMYGFHKKVGLSDNSMRASEKKARTPSEYENPYFKRDRPELLWLIAKPRPQAGTTKKKGKRSGDGDQESEEDDLRDPEDGGQESQHLHMNRPSANLDLVTLPRSQLHSFQREIDQLKKSQQQINSMIARFQHENNQYIRQASAQHERHENSINAILTFLATFYSRSVEGTGNPTLFPGAIPNVQAQGNVVEEEYDEPDAKSGQLQRVPRRSLALLPAPDAKSGTPDGSSRPSSSTTLQQSPSHLQAPQSQPMRSSGLRNPVPQSEPPSNRATPSPLNEEKSTSPSPEKPAFDNSDGQTHYSQASQTNTNTSTSASDIMAVINNVNATTPTSTTANFDISSALHNYENSNGNAPLTPEQRDSVLSLMANTSGANTPIVPNNLSNANSAGKGIGSAIDAGVSNALLRTESAQDQAAISQFNQNRDAIDTLQRLQDEQNSKLHDLSGRLQPLSPNGSIPGLEISHLGGVGGRAGMNAMFSGTTNSSPLMTNVSPDNNEAAFSANNAVGNGNASGTDFDMNTFLNNDYFQDFPPASTSAAVGGNNDLGTNFSHDNGSGLGMGNLDFDTTFGDGSVPNFGGFDENAKFDGEGLGCFDGIAGVGGGGDAGQDNAFGGKFDRALDDDGGAGGAGGRIVGSVGSSSAGGSPGGGGHQHEGGGGDEGGGAESRRKRQRRE